MRGQDKFQRNGKREGLNDIKGKHLIMTRNNSSNDSHPKLNICMVHKKNSKLSKKRRKYLENLRKRKEDHPKNSIEQAGNKPC